MVEQERCRNADDTRSILMSSKVRINKIKFKTNCSCFEENYYYPLVKYKRLFNVVM